MIISHDISLFEISRSTLEINLVFPHTHVDVLFSIYIYLMKLSMFYLRAHQKFLETESTSLLSWLSWPVDPLSSFSMTSVFSKLSRQSTVT